MSFSNEVLEQDARAQSVDAKNRAAWEEILNADDTDVSEGESFYQRVLQFCEGEISRDRFDLLAATCPAGFDFTNSVWHQGTKENLIEKIVEKKRRQLAPTGVLDPRDAAELRSFEANLLNLSKAQLRAKRNEQQFKEEIRTASQAKDFLVKHRLLEEQQFFYTRDGAGPYPRMPLTIVPPNRIEAVDFNARYICSLSGREIEKLCFKYSNEQVNARIAATQDSLKQ